MAGHPLKEEIERVMLESRRSSGLSVGVVPILGPVAAGLASAVTGAFLGVVSVVFYFEIRCRKEAFEIEHLAQLVEGAGAAAAASGS